MDWFMVGGCGTRRLASLTIGRARRIPTHALADYVQRHLEEATR